MNIIEYHFQWEQHNTTYKAKVEKHGRKKENEREREKVAGVRLEGNAMV